MPNSTSNISQPALGMNTDLNDLSMKPNQYNFCLNGTIENETGSTSIIQNDSSNVLAVDFPEGYIVIGRRYIVEAERTIFALVNPITGMSEFGEVRDCYYDDNQDDVEGNAVCCDEEGQVYMDAKPLEKINQTPYCAYRTIVHSSCLNFNINYPVDIEYRVTNYGINIYFVEYNNPIRFLYFDYDNNLNLHIQNRFKVVTGHDEDNCDLPIYGTELDCNKISYNPNFARPCIEYIDLVSGGSVKAGVVQFLVAYADINSQPLTKYFPASAPIPIRSKDVTFETNYETNKAVSLKINNLENTELYSYYNIVVAETADNVTQFKLVATLPVTQESYTYTGNDSNYRDVTPNDVFFERPIYSTAGSITKANDYLFFAKLKENKRMNLQRVANRIKLYWQTKAIAESDLRNAKNSSQFRSYMRDEVYPLGIVFEMTDDNDTIAFHIPGPSKEYLKTTYNLDVEAVITNNDVITNADCDNQTRDKLWQTYNTALKVGSPHTYTRTCEDTACWEWGEFGYWESTKLYPNIPEIWGELCGKPIRHPKMPDSTITHIHDGLEGSKGFTEDNIVYPLGIKVDEDSIKAALAWAVSQKIITEEERKKIKGYRIVRGNRVGNKSIEAKGLLYDMWYYDKDGNRIYYPNYGYNDLRQDPFLAPDAETYHEANDQAANPSTFTKTGRYTFHSPDVHFTNARLGSEIKLETEEYGTSEGFFNLCDEQPKYKLLSTAAYTLAFSFGIAAAISSLEEKVCRTYTKKADYLSTQDDSHISQAQYNSGQTITGGGLVEIATVNLGGYIGAHSSSNPDVTEQHNRDTITPYRKSDGREIGIPQQVESVTYNDCKGSTYQVLNSHSELGGIGGFLSGVIGSLTGLTVNGIVYRTIIGLREMQLMLDLFESLVPKKNFAIQYNSVGKYNNYTPIANDGNKVRRLDYSTYLTPNNQIVGETVPVKVNNWHRESSVFLKADGTKLLPNTTHIDDSRVTMDDVGLEYDDLNKTFTRNVASYYCSIKNYVPDQYGSIYNIEYLETNSCSFSLETEVNNSDCTTIFGGDTFINRFALKRKHPFFLQTRFRQLEDADVAYEHLGNAAFPNFYFNTKQELFERLAELDIGDIFSSFTGFLGNVLNVPKSRLDAKVESSFFFQKGYIHLYHYGIPYFLVESDINVDYRHAENSTDKDYYPHNTQLNDWLQEKNVPIQRDNFYGYNKSYSKQNKESALLTIRPENKFNNEKEVTHNNLLIYTDKNKVLGEADNWLITRANNFYKTDLSKGSIISVDGIENEKVLIRSENGSQIFNAYDTIQTSAGQLQVGNGGIFNSRPQDFSVTDLGFMGSQHRDILKTEFGHVTTDAKRGNIFLLAPNGQSIDELGKYNMRNWFKQNLPFQLAKDVPNLNTMTLDNNYNGIGLHMGFDKRFNRFFLTKLDYKLKDKTLKYDGNQFYIDKGTKIIDHETTVTSCPVGSTLVDGKCVKVTKTPATPSTVNGDFIATSKEAYEYAALGTAVYTTYQPNGTGNFISIPSTNKYWINMHDSTDRGPLNRSGIWNNLGNYPYNEWVGITVPIDVPEDKTYFIGIAGDNTARIKVGCNVVVEMDVNAMMVNHNYNEQITFIKWHIYPVFLTKGMQYVEVAGLNYGNIAVFGAEIYENTQDEIINAQSDADLNIIFSTYNLIGQPVESYKWVCDDCSAVVEENGSFFCIKKEEVAPITTTVITHEEVPDIEVIPVGHPDYFQKLGWTISYNFLTKSWVSYHSFVPNYYVDHIDYFQTGIQSSLWSHNVTNKSFQVYYGNLYPFTIDMLTQPSVETSYINSIDYISDTLRYHNNYNWFYNRNITFNKAIVYNERQNSGELDLIPKNEDDLSTVGVYPQVNLDSVSIELSNSQNVWSFNGFYDYVRSQKNNIPIWVNDENNVDKKLNLKAFDYLKDEFDLARIRSRVCHVRLTNDKWSNFKINMFVTEFNQNKSFR